MIILNYTDSIEIYKVLQHINTNGLVGFGLPTLLAKARAFGWTSANGDLKLMFNKVKSCYGMLETANEYYDDSWVMIFEATKNTVISV